MRAPGALNLAWARFLVERLHRQGVSHFGVAPGSRSAPLALAVAQNHEIASTVHFDERGLAYHAVGYMRGAGHPAAVICTSGTAVANFFPAVVEASQDNLPMIVLTADRPPELRNCGANQTIDQLQIFGDYVRYFADLSCPDDDSVEEHAGHIDNALRAALGPQPGPVHLNCPYREPLVPDTMDEIPRIECPTPLPIAGANPVDTQALEKLLAGAARATRGLVIVGRLATEKERKAVAEVCHRLDWPAAVDITSGLRGSGNGFPHGAHDLVFKNEHFRSRINPDFILHFGGQMVSKHLITFLSEHRGAEYWSCSGGYRPFDPAHAVTNRVAGDLTAIAKSLVAIKPAAPDPDYRQQFQSAFDTVEGTVNEFMSRNSAFTEFTIARSLANNCRNDRLFLAGSLTIRDFDWFTPRGAKLGMIAANRGASGIDGNLASAVGFARGLKAPVTVVLGDLAMLHDLNSLALAAKAEYPVTIIVVNNQGGRIFEMLPIAEQTGYFEEYFAAQHSLTFEEAAAMFKLQYARTDDINALLVAAFGHQASGKPHVFEVTVDPEAASAARKELFARIDHSLNEL